MDTKLWRVSPAAAKVPATPREQYQRARHPRADGACEQRQEEPAQHGVAGGMASVRVQGQCGDQSPPLAAEERGRIRAPPFEPG